jgi:hypothetical protein
MHMQLEAPFIPEGDGVIKSAEFFEFLVRDLKGLVLGLIAARASRLGGYVEEKVRTHSGRCQVHGP